MGHAHSTISPLPDPIQATQHLEYYCIGRVMNRLFILLPEPKQPEQPDH
jgi:hypothetical protein